MSKVRSFVEHMVDMDFDTTKVGSLSAPDLIQLSIAISLKRIADQIAFIIEKADEDVKD